MPLPVLVAPEIPGSHALLTALAERGHMARMHLPDSEPPARGVCIRMLPPGTRQVPPPLLHWLQGSHDRTVVLVCQEALSSPVIRLHRDQVVLVADRDPERLTTVVAAVASSNDHVSSVRTQRGAGWRMLIADESRLVSLLTGHAAAVLGPQPPATELLESTLHDPPTARLARLAADGRGAGVVQLDTDNGLWLATMPAGAPMQVVLAGPGRIPGAMPLGRAPGNVRLRAHPGDALIAAWDCELPAMSVLASNATRGAEALLEAATMKRKNGAVLVLEARS